MTIAGATVLGSAMPLSRAGAQAAWPDKPVKVIVPYAAGGATDAIARPWCEEFSKALGQQFVVENRGGASGMIGTEAVAKSPPDGSTLLMTPNAPLTVLPTLRKTPYDPRADLVPISHAGEVLNGFVTHPSVGVRTWPEFVDFARKNPSYRQILVTA
jgi:tripartite-type tricarboxylate transporter receptor subunit TctC